MKKFAFTGMLALALVACSSPNDVVLGPEPLKQIAEQGDKFKRMPEEDRMLLVGYLSVAEMSKIVGKEAAPVTGRTVAEVMKDARAWQQKVKAAEAEQAKREAEALALRKKIEAENKLLADQIAGTVTVAVTDKTVLPKNYGIGRYSELLMIKYAVENKSEKTIRQIKGIVSFVDPSGDDVGNLHVDIDSVVKPGATVRTDTGSGWRTNSFSRSDIEKIAERDFSAMSGSFKVTSIAFAGGEVLKLNH